MYMKCSGFQILIFFLLTDSSVGASHVYLYLQCIGTEVLPNDVAHAPDDIDNSDIRFGMKQSTSRLGYQH